MDDSFTKFPNSILEALVGAKLSSLQLRTFLYIVRWTVGYKNMHRRLLSVSQMARDMGYDKTGFSRQHIKDAVRDLEQMGMIKIEKRGCGAKSIFEVLTPDNWDKPAPPDGQEPAPIDGQVDAPKEGQVTCPARRAPPAPPDGQEPAPIDGHIQRNKENSKEIRKKENIADHEVDDDDGEDPLVLWERIRHEYEHL